MSVATTESTAEAPPPPQVPAAATADAGLPAPPAAPPIAAATAAGVAAPVAASSAYYPPGHQPGTAAPPVASRPFVAGTTGPTTSTTTGASLGQPGGSGTVPPPVGGASQSYPPAPPAQPLPPLVDGNGLPPPPPTSTRPCILLSKHLVATYKTVNEKYFLRKRLEGPDPKFNSGFDDREGHYIIFVGEEILHRYTVQEVLGKGSFGTVARCYDAKRQEVVALKITRSGTSFRNQAKQEIDIIVKLNSTPALNDVVARILKAFDWKGHLVLAFELYSYNLYQLLQCTNFHGVSLDLTRKFAWQILQVLQGLQNMDPPIIHCDLKPENVLLKHNNRSGVRVIDFGSACYETRRYFKYIQSRFYRAPEVILHLEYGTAIDRWSLGVMLVELHCGLPLFDGRTEASQLQRFEGLLGPLPQYMIAAGIGSSKVANFFDISDRDGQSYYELKLKPEARHTRSLANVIGVTSGGPGGRRKGQTGHDQVAYETFFDFVSKLIVYDPAKRMSVAQAIQHPFIASLGTPQVAQPAPSPAVPPGTPSAGSIAAAGQQRPAAPANAA